MSLRTALICDVILPEVQRQLLQDRLLWPNVNGFFVVNVTKKRKPATIWYILLQGNQMEPIITNTEGKVRELVRMKKIPTVKIRIDDNDLLKFVTGGLTGIKAYVSRRIKIKGDLVLAQRLENLFKNAGGQERALDFLQKNEPSLLRNLGSSKL